MDSKKLNKEIYKAHEAVAVVPTTGSRITLLTRKFFNVLLQHAQSQGDVEIYRAPLSLILKEAHYTSTNLEVAKAGLRGMAKTTVEWSAVSDNEQDVERRWGVSALIAHAELIEQRGRLHLEWSYSPKFRHNLLDPARYVQLSLEVYSNLRSSSAAALYEICMRYLTNHKGLTNKAEWEWWRPRITGIAEGDGEQVRLYKYFKRDTLVPAIKEINLMTNIEVELHEFKTGRRITHLQFTSRLKSQTAFEMDDGEVFDNELLRRMVDLGVPETLTAKLYVSKDEQTLRATLDFVEARVAKGGVTSPVALFRDALKKGYGTSDAANTVKQTPVKRIKKVGPVEDPEVLQERENLVRADAYIQGLDAAQLKTLEQEFFASLGDTLVKTYYLKSGLKTKIVKSALRVYVQKNVLPRQHSKHA